MLTSAIEVMKYVRASAGRAGLSVVFEATNQPRHDGKTIYLPRITYKTTDEELKQLMASTDHEVGHDRYSSFEVLQKEAMDAKGILMFTWNFLEDSRVNTIEAKEYKGFRENWDECAVPLITPILERTIKEPSLMGELTGALIKWETELNAHMFPLSEACTHSFTPNEKIYDVLSRYSDRLIACHEILDKEKGTQATIDLAKDILKALGKEVDEKIEKLIKEAKKKAGKESKDGTKAPTVSPDSSEKSEGDESSGEDEGKEEAEGSEDTKDDDEWKIIRVAVTEEDLAKLSLSVPENGKEMGKTGINFSPVSSSKSSYWDMTDFSKFIVVDYPKKLGLRKYLNDELGLNFVKEYNSRVAPLLVTNESFAQQVRRLIQIRSRVQTEYGIKKGKLDQSRLSRVIFKQPGFSDRIFKRRIENKTLDAAISILVDMSGSMSGDKAFYALASTLLMTEVCSTLGIPLEITGFSDAGDYGGDIFPLMFIYKAFSDRHLPQEEMIRNFSKSSCFMAGNPDGENILWAYDRLVKRKEKRRILVVMSDGSPAASKCSTGLAEFTIKVINEIEASRKAEIYGLGLCTRDVTYYYKANSVVNRPEEIPEKLLELIERKILA